MSYLRFNKNLLVKSKSICLFYQRCLSNLEKTRVENETVTFVADNDVKHSVNCNRSGLLNQHRNALNNVMPYNGPCSWVHLTEKYQRKVFGRYGAKSGVNPRICFLSEQDVKSKARYEKLSEPETLLSMIRKLKHERGIKLEGILQRENDISKKIDKLDQWKKELHARVMKKEADALAARQRKERLIEEVRRHFGYKVDPKDERFKEVLEQKEREDKKKQKEAKRQAKEQKLMSKLVGNNSN